jgi:hypothetical protein
MYPQDDIIGFLLSQHDQARDLFAKVRLSAGNEKTAKFDELRALLAVHETTEEMIPGSCREEGSRGAGSSRA